MTSGTKPSSTRVEHACCHCGLPVPAGLVEPDATEQFCCGGCKAVWSALHACGLEKYYELAEKEAETREHRPAIVTHRKFAHLDRPEFLGKHAKPVGERRLSAEFRIDGLRCGACLWLLEALPRLVPGLVSVRVDLGRSAVVIDWDPGVASLSGVARRFDTLGYQLLPLSDPQSRERDKVVDRAWLIRIGVAAAIASNAMAVAFALYGGLFAKMSLEYRFLFQWVAVGLAFLSLLWPGRIFFLNAWTALRARTPHMDIPVATGLAAAVTSGLVNTIRGTGSIYCESATMLVFLLLVGRFVQYRQQRKARHEVELITSLVPAVARRRDAEGGFEEVPIESLVRGDVVQVPAGETVPCDGTLATPAGRFDLSLLTGESRPASVAAGDAVWAGTRPVDRPIEVVVEIAGSETRAGRLLALVSQAASRRPPIVEMADRMAGWFLMAVLLTAGFTTWWWWHLGANTAIERAVALLVVTCPCALGLATPLAVVAGIGKAARKGVLVKGGDVLERLANAGTIVLDKTGTITEGRVAVTGFVGSVEALSLAASLERGSAHPIAAAIVESFGTDPKTPAATEVEERAGRGVDGCVGGSAVAVGSERFMNEHVEAIPDWAKRAALEAALKAESPVFVAVDGAVQAVVAVGDPIRPEAKATIDRLRQIGYHLVMSSGDHPVVARSVGQAVGLEEDEIEGGCSPERKVEIVRDGDLPGPVVMVGDGVNDLAAMAAADVGIAVRNGAQSALHVADACLAAGGLLPLLRLMEGSRRTLYAIRLNLIVSVAYNVLGGALAFAGLVNPLVAAILMPVSGLTVVAIALAMPKFELTEEDGLRGVPP